MNDPVRELTADLAAQFERSRVLERLRGIMDRDESELHADQDELVRLGCETSPSGQVVKNSYGMFALARQASEHPEWAETIRREVAGLAPGIRFLIWAGMGGSIEDKLAYESIGLLRGGPRFYALDSTDPAKLKGIVHDLQERSKLPLPTILECSLIVGMAMGMTSYEPVLNLEKIVGLYEKHGVPLEGHFAVLTLPGSALDHFAEGRGLRRIPLQLDGRNTTAGRHSAPLTRGSLYPLALGGVDLDKWFAAAQLSDEVIHTAFKLGAFLQAQGLNQRDKVTLMVPKSWSGISRWTKQNFEESLGKSEALGIKIVIDERVRTRVLRKPGDARQDRCFLAVQIKGEPHPQAEALSELRRMSYPVAFVTVPKQTSVASWMQFVHYTVFGLAFLRRMNFVTQPSVELYKQITAELVESGTAAAAWDEIAAFQKRLTPERYASALQQAVSRGASYAELTFFGDMRYAPGGKALRKLLEDIGARTFRMPVDVGEGPAMNHSYHEMIIGHGRCFSTLIAAERQARFPAAKYEPDYHMAQFAATRIALERRGRDVIPLLIRDLEDDSLDGLEAFFREAASMLAHV